MNVATDTYTIYFDTRLNCVTMRWNGYATSEQFRTGTERMLQEIQKHKTGRVLADIRHMAIIAMDDQHWLQKDFLPRAFKSGFHSIAIVTPVAYFNKVAIQNITSNIPKGNLTISFFEVLKEAEKWLIEQEKSLPPAFDFDNFTLRFLQESDLKEYFHLIDSNRQRLEDFFAGTVSQTKTLEDTQVHLNDVLQKTRQHNYFPFVIEDNSSHKLIASLQVKNVDWSIPKAELGYYIDGAYERKGIVSRAIAFIVDYCFTQQNFNKLFIRTHKANVGSVKVAEKNHFKLEGTIRSDYKTTSGELVDLLYYGLLKSEWTTKK